MATVQTIERALREKFGSEETIITLAEILSFLKSHQNPCCAAGNPKNQQPKRGTQQNATPGTQSRDKAREAREPRATPSPATTAAPAAQSQGSTCQITCQAKCQGQGPYNSTAGPPKAAKGQQQGPRNNTAGPPKAVKGRERPKSTAGSTSPA